jgi:dinuclear metal center YbgI/SA1388 family protein
MPLIVGEIIDFLESEIPSKYACKWDNVGLLIGSRKQIVNKIMLAVDATNDVVNQAIKENVDMIITHHPIIFSEIKKITDEDFIGKKVIDLITNNIAVYASHTNLDACKLTHRVSELLNISGEALEIIDNEHNIGLGKVGNLEKSVLLGEYIEFVKSRLRVNEVKVFGQLDKSISKVAMSQGSGGSMIQYAIKEKADLLITGDIDHHEGIDALQQDLAIIDAGHFETEKFCVDIFHEMLHKNFENRVEIIVACESSPYKFI